MDEKINWLLVLALTGLGLVAVIGGLAVADFGDSAISGLLIEIGVGVGLIATVVLVERRLIRRISDAASAVAAEAVRSETAGFQERIVRLENLDEARQQERDRRYRSNDDMIRKVLAEELTAASLGELLVVAINDRLVDDRSFGVRTSDDPDSPVLHFCVLTAKNGVAALWLDFEALSTNSQVIDVPGVGPVPAPVGTEAAAMWIDGDSADKLAVDLELGLERINQPTNGFDLGYAIKRLTSSLEVMWRARALPAGSPQRLHGQLILLINDHWAITTHGVESIVTDIRLVIAGGGFDRTGGWAVKHIRLPDDFDETLRGWPETETWLSKREGITILRGGEQLEDPIARIARTLQA